ncbi:uncharacterized protein [Trachinotus anak]|uniref:uncharacterized protein isoform X2 n=1 Tax=Trachinotus anak TaxID=443729 RepID=UPI0039F1C110
MRLPLFALYATCLLCLGRMTDITTSEQSSSTRFLSFNVGENVTLECFYKHTDTAVMFYWYKQTLGQRPRLVSKFYKHDKNGTLFDEFKNNPRFELVTTTSKNHLKISGVQTSDSATYHCSGSETIQPGGSATLSCTVHTGTCDGEHSVYWFKDSESHPGLIYTHGDRNDQCERKPETQTHTCVYDLPMQSLNRSHAGTYYCAVASCGHILFGNGTKLHFEDEVDSFGLVYFLSGALAFNTILVVFLAYTAYTMHKANSCQHTDSQARSAASSAPNTEGDRDADDLHYAAIREHKFDGSRRQRNDTLSECVYSSVKKYNH